MNLLGGIEKEGYIGVYQRCGGLNSSRFNGKGQTEETWHAVFSYYVELWFAQLVLDIIADLQGFHENLICDENALSCEIVELFDKDITDKKKLSLKELRNTLKLLQRTVDLAVNNAALTGQLENLKILTTSGQLVFKIPQLLKAVVV